MLSAVLCACSVTHRPTIDPVGTDETLDVATWNVMRFGNDGTGPDNETQIANVRRIIQQAGVDVWALQEMEDRGDFERLLTELGAPWQGILDDSRTNLHLGFVYRSDVIQPQRTRVVLQQEARAFAGRPPLLMEAVVTLPGGVATVTFVNLHMKAFDDAASYERRRAAAQHIKAYLDTGVYRTVPLVVLGDFNDRLVESIHQGRPSPYEHFLADTAAYRFATYPLDDGGEGTYCFNATCTRDSAIDHIVVSDELFGALEGGAFRYDALLEDVSDYVATTSDHLPAVIRLRLGP